MSTSLGTFPRPVPRPLPGVTLPASPECSTPQSRGWLWGGWPWSRSLTRGWSSVWTWVLALVNVRVVGFVPGHCRAIAAPPAWRYPSGFAGVSFATVLGLVVWWSSRCLPVDDFGVDGVGHTGVRGCGRGCWPRCGSWWWPVRGRWSWLFVCSTLWSWLLAEDCVVVRVVAGRGEGRWSWLFVCLRLWARLLAEN